MSSRYRQLALLIAGLPGAVLAQGTPADYERAGAVRSRTEGLLVDAPESPTWISGERFWYRKSVRGGNAFVLVDAAARTKGPAFDHDRIATALSAATRASYTGVTLPFTSFSFADSGRAIEVMVDSTRWRCTLSEPACSAQRDAMTTGGRGGRGGGPRALFGGGLYGNDPTAAAPTAPRAAPDGRSEAFIRDHNVWMRVAGSSDAVPLSFDGTPGNAYDLQSLSWSPDSRRLAAYRIVPGNRREIHYVQSSPPDQVQPRTQSRLYNKPGDVLDAMQPVLFDVGAKRQINVSNALFPDAYTMSALSWRQDGRAVWFEYNQRGHQVFRVIEIDAATGAARAVISEEPKTFFTYSSKKYRADVRDGREIIWMSERDGWNHLYLYDGTTGTVRNQITRGEWVVRDVARVDTTARHVWFRANGMRPNEDP